MGKISGFAGFKDFLCGLLDLLRENPCFHHSVRNKLAEFCQPFALSTAGPATRALSETTVVKKYHLLQWFFFWFFFSDYNINRHEWNFKDVSDVCDASQSVVSTLQT